MTPLSICYTCLLGNADKARKRWIYQNAPALIEQDKKLQQQQQGR